jgi:hypothetical protein
MSATWIACFISQQQDTLSYNSFPNTLREPGPNTLKERTTPISRPGIRKI